ncbi:Proline dehydrogenase 1 [Hibiscus syriacus]|uniref:Proline dehydrogenase n=1 Tax=Hibiscus syriacus TaxID=106335 RepID=A0A6A2WLI0_HIBSY|nr:Proline dehydrogenase 1 [Hibiscus syriacus]
MVRRLPTTNLRLFSRRLNTVSSSSSSIAAGSRLSKPEPAAPTIVDLDDPRKLFSSVSTSKFLRSLVNLGLVANETFVDFGMWVMNSRLVETTLVRDVILKTVKHTMFEHFCAGETTEEAGQCARKIHEAGLRGMLAYAVEHTSDNNTCDRNLEGFIRSVDFSKSLPPSSKCVDLNIPLTIDAEDTSLQPAIDYFTYSSAIMYNKDGNAIVYGTIQAYLKDAKERLFTASKTADKLGIPMGFKLVRGAYMSSETRVASRFGFDSPIHDSIDKTHSCYDECASFMLERIANGNDAVVLATHNLQSGKLAALKARNMGIRKGNPKLEFAQLYGCQKLYRLV